jgi:hypothetical protein
LSAHCLKRDGERLKSLGCNAFAFMNETEKDVLGADV